MINTKQKETMIKPLIYNAMFEVVFERNVEVVIAIINDCCGTNYNVDVDDIRVEKRDIPRKNIREISLTCDYIIVVNKYYLYNIELNKKKYNGLIERNYTYVLKLHASRIPTGATYKEFTKYQTRQLNFNKYKNDENLGIDVLGWSSYITNNRKFKNIGVFQFDIEFCYNLVYNNSNKYIEEVSKLYRWVAIFNDDSIEKIDYILGSNMLDMKTKKDFLKRIKDASTDEIVLSKISLE